MTYQQLADLSGVVLTATSMWFRGDRSPGLLNFEACLNALGYELTITKKEKDD